MTQEPMTASYSASATSPNSATSPSTAAYNSPFSYNTNKFTFPNESSSPQSQNNRTNFRPKSFGNNSFNPSGGSFEGNSPNYQQHRFQHNYNNNQQQQNGVNLFIKANNVTEDLLRSLFNANVSQAKILSIDVKTKFVKRSFLVCFQSSLF